MLRCPSCQSPIEPPKDKKVFDCGACQTPIKRRGMALRNYGAQFLFVFVMISMVLAGFGPIFAVVVSAGLAFGLWHWLGNSTLAVVRN